MQNNAHQQHPQPNHREIARGRAEAFPSDRMAKMVFQARFSSTHRNPRIDEILAIKTELGIHFHDTILEMTRFIKDGQELQVIDDGDIPTMDFATRMLHRLHIVGHNNEDGIMALMGSELMAGMIYPSPKVIPVNGSYELAYDAEGDTLVLRPKTAGQESPFRPYKNDRAAA